MDGGATDVQVASNQSLLLKTGKTQAAFVPKLFLMVKDMKQPTPNNPNPIQPLISWSKMGDVFCVFDPIEFSREILPLHFKHNNWQSFVRQLNMYGFHKVNDLLASSHCHPDTVQAWEFRHPHFKRGRADLLPMIKRKSTKHHGSSKKTSNPSPSMQPSSQVSENRLHLQRPTTDVGAGRPPRLFPYPTRSHEEYGLSPAQRPLRQPPPAPALAPKASNPLPTLIAHPPVLFSLGTHPLRFTNSLRPEIRSSPILKGSPKCLPPQVDPSKHSVTPCSPRSIRPGAPLAHSIVSHPQRCNMNGQKVSDKDSVDAWSDRPELIRRDSSLSRIEAELRRLNDRLSRQDEAGNQIFSVLGLITELVTVLVDNQAEKIASGEKQELSHYIRAAQDALGKLESFHQVNHDSLRRCSGAPSTDSTSPISTDPLERLTLQPSERYRGSVDSNSRPAAEEHLSRSRPRCPDRMASSHSLPPLSTLMAQCELPKLNSSGALPPSINRLMNDEEEERHTIAMTSEEEEEAQENEDDEIDEDEAGGQAEGEEEEEEEEEEEGEEEEEYEDDYAEDDEYDQEGEEEDQEVGDDQNFDNQEGLEERGGGFEQSEVSNKPFGTQAVKEDDQSRLQNPEIIPDPNARESCHRFANRNEPLNDQIVDDPIVEKTVKAASSEDLEPRVKSLAFAQKYPETAERLFKIQKLLGMRLVSPEVMPMSVKRSHSSLESEWQSYMKKHGLHQAKPAQDLARDQIEGNQTDNEPKEPTASGPVSAGMDGDRSGKGCLDTRETQQARDHSNLNETITDHSFHDAGKELEEGEYEEDVQNQTAPSNEFQVQGDELEEGECEEEGLCEPGDPADSWASHSHHPQQNSYPEFDGASTSNGDGLLGLGEHGHHYAHLRPMSYYGSSAVRNRKFEDRGSSSSGSNRPQRPPSDSSSYSYLNLPVSVLSSSASSNHLIPPSNRNLSIPNLHQHYHPNPHRRMPTNPAWRIN